MATLTVLGAGMMGSALTVPLVDAGHEVRLVGTHLDEAIVERLATDRVHPKMGLALPEAVTPLPLSSLAEAMEGADAIALGVSSAGLDWAAEQIAPFVRADRPVFMITKGLALHEDALEVLPDRLARLLPAPCAPAAIAGPCIAGELALRVPTCVVLTGRDRAALERIRGWIGGTDYYHVALSDDVVGVECCAALKNAYAMGVAFPAGMHASRGGAAGSVAMHNLESAIFAQAIVEMDAVVGALGGARQSVMALAGVGDLDVTNNGGRTGRFGRHLGRGLTLPEAIEAMEGATLECLEILAVMRAALPALRARQERVALPLIEHLMAVALDGAPVDLPLARFFGGGA